MTEGVSPHEKVRKTMKLTKKIMTMATCAVMAASSMVGLSASIGINASAANGIVNESQTGYYYNTDTSSSNYDSSAYIYISQSYIYLNNVYVGGHKVRANIYKDNSTNEFSISDGYVTITLNSYMYYNDGQWETGTSQLQAFGEANSIIYKNPLNPVWTLEFDGQTFEEEQ